MKKIAIIGAGISGLYLANLLETNSDFIYKIYERRSNLDLDDGYGIQLSVNGVRLLNKIGFKNLNASDLSYPKKVNFFDAKNKKKITDINITQFNDETSRYTTLKRSTLIKFLMSNLSDQTINYDTELEKVSYGEQFIIDFSNNSKETFDYIIISDGVFSKTKSIINKKETKPKYFNGVALRGNLKNYDNTDISIFMGSDLHYVIYPVNQNKEYNFISVIHKKLTDLQLSDQKFLASEDFKSSIFNTLKQKTSIDVYQNLENINVFPIFVSEKTEKINQKNIFFIGDALFSFPPSFAQGASQSIETSHDLFKYLKNNEDILYKDRINKIHSVNLRSKLNHFAFHLKNPLIKFLRNIILKYLTKNDKFLDIYLGKIYKN
ncbi:FAD-dependent monooxygenase [Candidatus Pelagibacter sp.]|nr:FAD-dependent monooxygenase [Candidatus Pelagibacter sp.]